LSAAKALRRADADVTIIDRTNHHRFQLLFSRSFPWVSRRVARCCVEGVDQYVCDAHVGM
jgi:hypothetical protein